MLMMADHNTWISQFSPGQEYLSCVGRINNPEKYCSSEKRVAGSGTEKVTMSF